MSQSMRAGQKTQIRSIEDLFGHLLKDIYYAEHQIIKNLPKMIEKANDNLLKQGLQEHLEETRGQVRRLDQVFQLCKMQPEGVECQAIDGILAEAEEVMGEVADAHVRDAAICASAQAVEHYEITRYGTMVALAIELDRPDAAELLKETLGEEKAADRKLTEVAEERTNRIAAA